MRFKNLQEWLAWQEQLHPNVIDLGLHRVQHVLKALGLNRPAYPILTIGGTNGKGSSVSFAESMLRAAGHRVGAYVSPHILRYNERVRVDGVEAPDGEFCEAFERIDAVRGDLKVTYFEFGTLAAIDIFARRQVSVAVLEVGLGGRLDAVNTLDADASLVTSIGLDHQEWLGDSRDSIGREKAGIFRAGRPAVCGDRNPPASLVEQAASLGAPLQVLGRDFDHAGLGDGWSWRGTQGRIENLPAPALPGRIQYDNASAVIAALKASPRLSVQDDAVRQGLREARIAARFQRVSGPVETIFDVAHNPDAARVLAGNLRDVRAPGRTLGVMGMFKDKAVEEVAEALAPCLDGWYLAGLEGPRGQSAAELATRVQARVPGQELRRYPSVAAAYAAAHSDAKPGDRVVVFGSFQTVGSVLRNK